jgi:antitoxin component YwqK of YwqJK toxin-antitoxin module
MSSEQTQTDLKDLFRYMAKINSDEQNYVYTIADEVTYNNNVHYWVIILKKTDTTNEVSDDNIVNEKFALFRGDNLIVEKIIDPFDPSFNKQYVEDSQNTKFVIDEKTGCKVKNNTIFEVGKLVNDIDYFKSLEAAIYDLPVPKNYTGMWREYADNGQLEFEGEYVNGKMSGRWNFWDITGKKIFEGEYSNDKLVKRHYVDYEL